MIKVTGFMANISMALRAKSGGMNRTKRSRMAHPMAKLPLLLCCMIICSSLFGCAARTVTNVNLLYDNQLPIISNEGNNVKIYLVRPSLGSSEFALNNRLRNRTKSVVGIFHFERNGIDSPEDGRIGIFDQNYMPIARTAGANPVNISTWTDDSPVDWVSGALGAELKARGYDVEYVANMPNDDNLSISVVINKCKADIFWQTADSYLQQMNRISLRSTIELGFTISKNGKTLYKFDVADGQGLDESQFNKCAVELIDFHKDRMALCHSDILKTTLRNTLEQATKTILSFRKEYDI